MAIKSTKKVLASVLSLAVVSQPFCGAMDFMENKVYPRKSRVVKKEKATAFNKIKEFAKKHPVKAAVGGVAVATPVLIGLGLAINYLVSSHGVTIEELKKEERKCIENKIAGFNENSNDSVLTAEDVSEYIEEGNKFAIYEDGTLEIKGERITEIEMYAFCKTNITKIKIPDSVTTIGKYAFGGCTNLKEVTIPDSVTTIGKYAFGGCTNLKKVTIPDSVKTIDDCAFGGCTNLKEVTIPDSVTTIGKGAFVKCTNLKKVIIPANCKYHENNSFPKSCEVTIRGTTN